MKKFLMMVALMLTVSTATFAGNDDVMISEIDNVPTYSYVNLSKVELNYDFNINYNKLFKYLKLNERDFKNVKNTHDAFREGMLLASKAQNRVERDSLIKNSIDYEVRNMKMFLSDKQYRKFLRVFNTSLNNRGFIVTTNSFK